jgi:hypothetical protein
MALLKNRELQMTVEWGNHPCNEVTGCLFTPIKSKDTHLRHQRSSKHSLLPDCLAKLRFDAQQLDTTFPTATPAVMALQALGIVTEITGQKKNRQCSYQAYVELLSQ